MRMDERVTRGEYRVAGLLGPKSSSFTLAWLASHRDRLHTLLLGGKKLSVLVVWDSRGSQEVDRTDEEIDALRTIVYGPAPSDAQRTPAAESQPFPVDPGASGGVGS